MFSESILHVGLAQSLFAAFVLITKKRVEISDRIMIACLLTFAGKFSIFILHAEHSEFFDLAFSMGVMPMTFGPYMYLYTTYLVENRTKFRLRDLLHFVPFLAMTWAYFMFFKDVVDFSEVNYFANDSYLVVRVLYGLIFFTSVVTYTVMTYVKLWRYRRSLSENFSYWNRQLKLLWLNFIPGLFATLFVIYFTVGFINAFSFKKVYDITMISHIGLTIIAFSMSYFGLRQPTLFRPTYKRTIKDEEEDAPVVLIGKKKTTEEEEKKKAKARFTEEEAERLLAKLTRHMESAKPYLTPDLTLYDLASQVNLSKNDLTELLNNHLGKNFFSFVNEYRLAAVIERLENPDYDHFTIISIAYDCGFNSKSTFNNLFKQHTGLTPSEYKKENSITGS